MIFSSVMLDLPQRVPYRRSWIYHNKQILTNKSFNIHKQNVLEKGGVVLSFKYKEAVFF